MQIGFSQLNTPFTEHDGVGDDGQSYAVDGFRISKWNGSQVKYGKHWQVGKNIAFLFLKVIFLE